jgi:hypothetical protein
MLSDHLSWRTFLGETHHTKRLFVLLPPWYTKTHRVFTCLQVPSLQSAGGTLSRHSRQSFTVLSTIFAAA